MKGRVVDEKSDEDSFLVVPSAYGFGMVQVFERNQHKLHLEKDLEPKEVFLVTGRQPSFATRDEGSATLVFMCDSFVSFEQRTEHNIQVSESQGNHTFAALGPTC